MLPSLIPLLLSTTQLAVAGPPGASSARSDLPRVADGWSVALECKLEPGFVPSIASLASAPDGTAYIGLWPLDHARGPEKPSGAIVAVKAGSTSKFATDLGYISGLEWVDGALYALHSGSLSSIRPRTDGRGGGRLDLVRGLGPKDPAAGGEGPVVSGLKLGLDGFLYFAVDDRGLWNARGKDEEAIRLQGGGLVRVRPDGSRLEVVSTGERRPRSVALDASGEVFTLGEPDPGGRWVGGLTHHIEGGHFGYPYQFLTAPQRALPLLGGGFKGPVGQLLVLEETGLPPAMKGSLFACDLSAQAVVRLELRKAGGTFAIARRTVVAERGDLTGFRPVAIGPTPGGDGLWLADAGASAHAGRLYRLTYIRPDATPPGSMPRGEDVSALIRSLDDPSPSVRIPSQRRLVRSGESAVGPLCARLEESAGEPGRVHALWALDELDGEPARQAIRARLRDGSARIRLQAARSCGRRRDVFAVDELCGLLDDRDPAVRREAAVALGRIGDRDALERLLGHLTEPDRYAASSVRTAIRRLGYPDKGALTTAFVDSRRREAALLLAEEAWSVPVVQALVDALRATTEPMVRGRIVAALSSQYRALPEWTGEWWGPKPLSAGFPRKSRDWSAEGQSAVLQGLKLGLSDPDPNVRYQAIFALGQVGPEITSSLRSAFAVESDTQNQVALVEAIGTPRDRQSTEFLMRIVSDAARPESLRAAALDALASLRGPDVLRVRLGLLYDQAAPGSLVARALPPLAKGGFLPLNDLADFLEHHSPLVRAAAVLSLSVKTVPPPEIRRLLLARLDDGSDEVRQAAVLAAGALKLSEAVPRLIKMATEVGEDLRPQAISALCQMPDRRAIEVYRSARTAEDPALGRAADRALQALAAPLDSETLRARMANGSRSSGPESLRRFAIDHRGDPRKGEELFLEHRGVSCARCHASNDRGGLSRISPRDAAAARRTRSDLIDSLLNSRGPVSVAHRAFGPIDSLFSAIEFTDLISFLQER